MLIIFNLISIIILLIGVSFLAEQKVLGITQYRRGSNVIGFLGLLQPLSDGLKSLIKEPVFLFTADKIIFLFAPIVTFLFSLVNWVVIPFSTTSFISEISLRALYSLVISSLGIYGILMSGWSSNSKYELLGFLCSAAQMASYKLSLGIIINILVCTVSSFILKYTMLLIMTRFSFFYSYWDKIYNQSQRFLGFLIWFICWKERSITSYLFINFWVTRLQTNYSSFGTFNYLITFLAVPSIILPFLKLILFFNLVFNCKNIYVFF